MNAARSRQDRFFLTAVRFMSGHPFRRIERPRIMFKSARGIKKKGRAGSAKMR